MKISVRNIAMIAATGVWLGLMSGCAGNGVQKESGMQQRKTPEAAYVILKSGNYVYDQTLYMRQKPLVASFYSDNSDDLKAFETLWKKLTGKTQTPIFDGVVIVVTTGSKPTGGYRPEVSDIEEKEDRIIVTVRTVAPSPGTFVTQALTQPWLVFVLPQERKEVEVVVEP